HPTRSTPVVHPPSLHDALPICARRARSVNVPALLAAPGTSFAIQLTLPYGKFFDRTVRRAHGRARRARHTVPGAPGSRRHTGSGSRRYIGTGSDDLTDPARPEYPIHPPATSPPAAPNGSVGHRRPGRGAGPHHAHTFSGGPLGRGRGPGPLPGRVSGGIRGPA